MLDKTEISASKIRILPDFIANQIAAGEVVQRPESVVKELVENSFDAGADSIIVIIKDAGKQLIHIVDNGTGMTKEDLLLSTKRHATSKIFTQDDLEKIITFGFRGEALASISSVANIEIRTKTKDDSYGWKLISEPLAEPRIEPVNTELGSQVFVRNLFYNVPARRKFLKSNLTEFRYISDTMIKFALSHPDKRITFYDDDTLIFDLHPESLESRIVNALGTNHDGSLIKVDYKNELMHVHGYIGHPHLARQSKSGQYFFLNGRSIQNKSLSHAVFTCFEHLLEKNKNPVFIINLVINPGRIDVNVHPQKHEVKFDDERYVYNTIHKAVSLALVSQNLVPESRFAGDAAMQPFITTSSGNSDNNLMLVNKVTGEVIEPTFNSRTFGGRTGATDYQHPWQESRQDSRFNNDQVSAFQAIFGRGEASHTPQSIANNQPEHSEKPVDMFWQFHNKYIVTQTENGIMIVDQHAAHERILYEKAVKMMNREYSSSQELLFPVEIQMNPSLITLVKELESDLVNLGFKINISGSDTITVFSVPSDLRTGEEAQAIREIIETYDEMQKLSHTDRRDNLAASYSCKAAIKSGQKLSNDEMSSLLKSLFNCTMPYVCPHGRPVVLEYSLTEFDRQFKRI